MSHPDCAVKKQAHFLEHTLEWRVFDAVQPLFASANLRWCIAATDVDLDATAVGSLQDAWMIESENAFDLFKDELEALPESAPDRAIDCRVFDRCQNYLAEVLDLFNGYVEESALEAARTPPIARGNLAPPSDASDEQVCPDLLDFLGLQYPTSRR
jgi:hypothetical protein